MNKIILMGRLTRDPEMSELDTMREEVRELALRFPLPSEK